MYLMETFWVHEWDYDICHLIQYLDNWESIDVADRLENQIPCILTIVGGGLLVGKPAVVARLAFVSLGDLVSVEGKVSTLLQSSVTDFTPWKSWPALRRSLTLPTSCLLVAVRTTLLLVSLELLATSCSSTALSLMAILARFYKALSNWERSVTLVGPLSRGCVV